MANWEKVADLATDAVPRVVHGGLVAVNHAVAAFSTARSARESEQTGELQTVLALMAWAGAVRVRVAGAHVLYRMDAMPASLKVCAYLTCPDALLQLYTAVHALLQSLAMITAPQNGLASSSFQAQPSSH